MDARALAWLGLAVAACQPDYVHVIVQSSSSELAGVPWTVSVRAYGDGRSASKDYRSFFDGPSPLYQSDFVLLLDSAPDEIDLRVAVWNHPRRWAGDRILAGPGDGRDVSILLHAGAILLGTAQTGDGELVSLTRFTSGLAMAWISTDGVALRIERYPDNPVSREVPIADETAATKLRIASRPTTNLFGPDLIVVSWIDGSGQGRLHLQFDDDRTQRIDLGPTGDLWAAIAPAEPAPPFAVATATPSTTQLVLAWYDDAGGALGQKTVAIPRGLRRITGFAAAAEGVLLAAVDTMEGNAFLLRHRPDDSDGDALAVDHVEAMSLSADQSRLFTVQRNGDLFVQSYEVATFTPAGEPQRLVAADQVPEGFFGGVAISSCAVAWPQFRDDGADERSVDLRVQDLDSTSALQRSSRLANGEVDHDHFAPSLACLSPSRAYTTFLVADAGDATGEIKLRQVPSAPIDTTPRSAP